MRVFLDKLILTPLLITAICFSSCKKDPLVQPEATGIRPGIDYSVLTPETPYHHLFLSKEGDSLVDLRTGNARHRMFQALNYYLGTAIRDLSPMDSQTLLNMFHNSKQAFFDINYLNNIGAELNKSGFHMQAVWQELLNLRNSGLNSCLAKCPDCLCFSQIPGP